LHKWDSAIDGNEKYIAETWGAGLAGLTGEDIKRGLESLSGEWPPSMPEFKELCLNGVKNGLGLDYTPPCHAEFKRDRAIESDTLISKRKKAARSAFANINKILKK